jgi:phosphocarrier protein HPr
MSSPEPLTEPAGRDGVRGEAVIVNAEGLHLRPATAFASIVVKSGCQVTIVTERGSANGSSVLELAMLAAPQGTKLEIQVTGDGCAGVLTQLTSLVEAGFKG